MKLYILILMYKLYELHGRFLLRLTQDADEDTKFVICQMFHNHKHEN